MLVARFLDFGGASAAPILAGQLDPRGYQPLRVGADTGDPVRFNPCEPVHYVMNPSNAPAGGLEDAHEAFETISGATGIKFVYDGTTDEAFSERRAAYQPDRYGERWAPILVTWSSHAIHSPDSSGGNVVGIGGPLYEVNEDGRAVYVTGIAVFDATDALSSGRGGAWRQVMLHELGHVMGLDHVEDPGSVMYTGPQVQPGELGDGDRAGLWELGLGSGCIDSPVP